MPNFNTIVSYAQRSLILAHLLCLAILLSIHRLRTHHPLNSSSVSTVGAASYAVIYFIGALLVLDWATRKDPSRRNPKVVDTTLGLAWALLIASLFLYSWGRIMLGKRFRGVLQVTGLLAGDENNSTANSGRGRRSNDTVRIIQP